MSASESFPVLTGAQRRALLTDILKGVSRSFYLTLAILPRCLREPIGLAYLIARAADTVADTVLISPGERLEYLRLIETQLDSAAPLVEIAMIPATMAEQQSHADEAQLLQLLPDIFALLSSQTPADKTRIIEVVKTLISGMVFDLQTFPTEGSGEVVALTTKEDLDHYTYSVAGCVGAFWTEMLIAHMPQLRHWQGEGYEEIGIHLGKALQYTNIIRDLPRDLRIGRCYIPQEMLQRHGLTATMLLDAANSTMARPCLDELLALARGHYEAARRYVIDTPRRLTRLRLAAFWPMIIGLETLNKLEQNRNWLDNDQLIKVERRWVYKMIFFSLFASHSNRLLDHWLDQILFVRIRSCHRLS